MATGAKPIPGAKVRILPNGQVHVQLPGRLAGRERNPGSKLDMGQLAFEAGKRWTSQAPYAGVANARIVRYGFLKWFNNLHPSEGRGMKSYLEKSFREGYSVGRR